MKSSFFEGTMKRTVLALLLLWRWSARHRRRSPSRIPDGGNAGFVERIIAVAPHAHVERQGIVQLAADHVTVSGLECAQ